MAISQDVVVLNLRTKPEIASRRTVFERVVLDDGRGADDSVSVLFPTSVSIQKTVYEVNDSDKPIGIYETADLGTHSITDQELMAVWAIPITRTDTGQSGALGEIFSGLIDEVIVAKLNPPAVVGP